MCWKLKTVSSTFFFFNFWTHFMACGILVPWPGIKPAPSSVEFQSYNPWLLGKSRAVFLCVSPFLILMMTPQLGVAINHRLKLRELGNFFPTIAKMQSLVLLTSSPSSLSCCPSVCHRIGSVLHRLSMPHSHRGLWWGSLWLSMPLKWEVFRNSG